MFAIHLNVALQASPCDAFRALVGRGGLRNWWDDEAGAALGATRTLRFEEPSCRGTVRVAEVERDAKVVFRCIDGPPDWVGTEIACELTPREGGTLLRFSHRAWKRENDFMAFCGARWAAMLFELKAFLETPDPDDVLV